MGDSVKAIMEGKWCVEKMMIGETDYLPIMAQASGKNIDPRESMYYIFSPEGALSAKMGDDEAEGTYILDGSALTLFTDPAEKEHGIEAVVDGDFFTITETEGDMITKMIYKKM